MSKSIQTQQNKDCILITAYTPSLEKTDNLRELVKSIKRLGYEVCLATHTPTPQDIIDRCDYFIFDKKNELNYDPSIAYWIYHQTPLFKINYKQYGAMSTHIIPIMRLVFGSLSYLKSLNVRRICMIEYDTIVHTDAVFNKVFDDLNTYDLSSLYSEKLDNKDVYLAGVYGINLETFDPSTFTTDPELLINLYREYFNDNRFPITEKILFDKVWSNYTIAWNHIQLIDGSIELQTSEGMNGYGKKSYLFHAHDNKLYFFSFNESEEDWEINIILNEKNNSVSIPKGAWKWIPLMEIDDVKNIKLIVNNVFIKEFNMNNKDDYDLIHKWAVYTPV